MNSTAQYSILFKMFYRSSEPYRMDMECDEQQQTKYN